MPLSRTLAATVVVGLLAASAAAGTIQIQSDGANSEHGLGEFTGSLSYLYDSGTSTGRLTVSLTNTSSTATHNGGFLTGFLFNIDGDATASLLPGTGFSGVEDESGSPYGTFEFGAALGGDFSGGGKPKNGLGSGVTGTYLFDVTGTAAALLDAHDFLSESSVGGSSSALFLVRFRGFEGEGSGAGSDKVPGVPLRLVPLPPAAAAGFLLLAFSGLARVARRRLRRGA